MAFDPNQPYDVITPTTGFDPNKPFKVLTTLSEQDGGFDPNKPFEIVSETAEEESSDVSKALDFGFAGVELAGTIAGRDVGLFSDTDVVEKLLEIKPPEYSPETQEQLNEIMESEGFFDTLGSLILNPRGTGIFLTENAAQLAASIPTMLGGGAAGAVVGSKVPVVGTVGGMITGAAVGTAIPTLALEYGNVMASELRGIGADTKEKVVAALQDDAFMSGAREKALKRGIPIAAFEALSVGLAGKAWRVATRLGAGRVAGVAGELGVQAATAAAGETTAQFLSEGKLVPRDIALEVGLEVLMSGPIEATFGAFARRGERADATVTDPAETPTTDLPTAPIIKDPRVADAAEEGVEPTSELDRFINELNERPKIQDAAKQLRDLDLTPAQVRLNMAALQDAVEINDNPEFDPTITFSPDGIRTDEGESRKGEFIENNREIKIDPKINPRAAMAHEVLHFHDTLLQQQDPDAHKTWASGFKSASTLRRALSPAVKRLLDPQLLSQMNVALQEQGVTTITPREARAYALELYKQTGKPPKRNLISRAFDFFSDGLDRIIAKMSGRMTQKDALLFAADGKITQQLPTTSEPEQVEASPAPKAAPKPKPKPEAPVLDFTQEAEPEAPTPTEYQPTERALSSATDSVTKEEVEAKAREAMDNPLSAGIANSNFILDFERTIRRNLGDAAGDVFIAEANRISEQNIAARLEARQAPAVEAEPEAPTPTEYQPTEAALSSSTESVFKEEVEATAREAMNNPLSAGIANSDFILDFERTVRRNLGDAAGDAFIAEANRISEQNIAARLEARKAAAVEAEPEGDASYVAKELEGAFMNNQAFENFLGNRDIQSRLINSISQRDLKGRPVDVDQVVERLKKLRNITDATQKAPQPEPVVEEPALPPEIPEAPASAVQPTDEISTNIGSKIGVTYEVKELADVVPSNLDDFSVNPAYPQALQPRDRTRAASEQQVNKNARTFNPEVLLRSPVDSIGAPVIGEDNFVESGNGRVLTIRKVAAGNPEAYQAYKQAVTDAGFDITGFNNPILVRVNRTAKTPEARKKFIEDTGKRAELGKSVSEVARTDAQRMTKGILDLYKPGEITSAANAKFVNTFMKDIVTVDDAAQYMTEKGQLSKPGVDRIEAALVQFAYEDDTFTNEMFEDSADDRLNVSKSLKNLAPQWAAMKANAEEGRIDAFLDTTEELREALNFYRRSFKEGRNIQEFTEQVDMLSGSAVDPVVEGWIKTFYKDNYAGVASQKEITSRIQFYIDQANKSAAVDLVGDTASPEQLLDSALTRQDPDDAQADLLADQPAVEVKQDVSPPAPAVEQDIAPPSERDLYDIAVEAGVFREDASRLMDSISNKYYKDYSAEERKQFIDAVNRLADPFDSFQLGDPIDSFAAEGSISTPFDNQTQLIEFEDGVTIDPKETAEPDREFSIDESKVVLNTNGKPFFGRPINVKDVRALRAAAQGEISPGRVFYPFGISGTGAADRGGFGQAHVKNRGHIEELQQLGFKDDVAAVEYVTANHTGLTVVRDARGNRPKGMLEATKRMGNKEYRIQAFLSPVTDPRTRDTHYAVVTIYSPDFAKKETVTADPVVRNREFSIDENKPALEVADKVHHRNQGSSAQLLDTIRDKYESFKGGQWITEIFDRYFPVNKLERDLFGGVLPDADKSAYKMMRLGNDTSGTIAAFLTDGQYRYTDKGFEPIANKKPLLKILEPILKQYGDDGLHLFGAYAYAVRANRLLADGRESILSQGEISTLLDLANKYPIFEQVRKEYVEFNDNVIQVAVDSNLLSEQQADTWRSFGDYVPFYRVLDPDNRITTPPSAGGFGRVGALSRRLRGGEGKMNNVIDNMVKNTEYLLTKSIKNRGMQLMVENFGPDTGMDVFKPVPSSFVAASKVTPDSIRQVLRKTLGESHPLVDEVKNIEGLQTIFTMEPVMRKPANNVVYVRRMREVEDPESGEMVDQHGTDYFEVNDTNLFTALSELPPNSMGVLIDILNISRTFFSRMITMMPDFMLANLMRDTMSTRALRGGYNPLTGVFKGLYKSLTNNAVQQELRVNGGMAIGGYYGNDLRRFKKLTGSKTNPVIAAPGNAWAVWDKVGQATEQANRLSVYESQRRRGVGGFEAGFQARDIIDYSLSGRSSVVQFLIRTVPFLNARAQGGYALARGLNRNNRKNFLLTTALYGAASTALFAMNYDDERYREESDISKDLYLHIYLDKFLPREALESVGITNPHIAIPKPFEIGAASMTVPERILQQIIDEEADGEDFVKSMGFITGGIFKIQPAEIFGPYAKGVIQDQLLYDFFRGRDLVPAHQRQFVDQEGEADATITDRTPEVIASIARSLDVAPQRVKNIVDSWFPKVGSLMLQGADMIFRSANGLPPLPQEFEDTIMGRFTVGRFHPAEFPGYSASEKELRELNAALKTLTQGIRNQEKYARSPERLENIFDDSGDKAMLSKPVADTVTELNEISALERLIRDSDMPIEEKRQQLDELKKNRALLARDTLKAYKGFIKD